MVCTKLLFYLGFASEQELSALLLLTERRVRLTKLEVNLRVLVLDFIT